MKFIRWLFLASLFVSSVSLARPSSAQIPIPAVELARQLDVLTADSMRGETPSPALERTAHYVATQLQHFGLKPADEKDGWIWRYPIPGQQSLNYVQTQVLFVLPLKQRNKEVLTERGNEVTKETAANFATAAHFIDVVGPPRVTPPTARSFFEILMAGSERVVAMTGAQTAASAAQADVRDKVVIYIPPVGGDSGVQAQIIQRLYDESRGVVLVGGEDPGRFAAALQRARQRRVSVVERYMRAATGPQRWPWAVEVAPEAVRYFLGAAGLDLAQARSDSRPTVRELPLVRVWFQPQGDTSSTLVTAPVVAGTLEGADSLLKGQYLVVSARMDGPGPSDSLAGGPKENALGTAGLLALAQAFSEPNRRPRYSVLFLATSGGAAGKAFWGSQAYLEPLDGGIGMMRLHLVADLDLDRIGLSVGDSVLIDGLQEVELTPRAEWIAAQHPDLGLAVADGGTVFHPTSGHYPFASAGFPSLSFHGGSADAIGRNGPVAFNVERAARRVRLALYVAQSIAGAEHAIRWNVEGRKHLGEIQEQ